MRRILLVTLLLVVVAPQAAHAGTVSLGSVATDPKYGYEDAVLSFGATPGERNRIVVAKVDANRPPTLVLRDEGALLQAGRGCTAIDANTASCVANYVSVDAGDGDDTVTLAPGVGDDQYGHYSPYVRGGDGADVLTGRGELLGGPGNDTLTCPEPCAGSLLAGGAGDDVLRGGNAADVLSGDGDGPAFIDVIDLELTESGPGGDDRIDGGGGRDRLSFEGRPSGVRADLAAGTATGAGGEQDGLAGIEDVIGGDGDDMLLGDAAANQLEGDAGDDRISGRAGDDYLLGDLVPVDNEYSVDYTRGSDGSDTLHGDAGDDVLDAGGERGDALSGGPGDDTLQNGLYGPTRARSVRCATAGTRSASCRRARCSPAASRWAPPMTSEWRCARGFARAGDCAWTGGASADRSASWVSGFGSARRSSCAGGCRSVAASALRFSFARHGPRGAATSRT